MTTESALMFSNFISAVSFLATLGVLVWSIKLQDTKEKKYINALLAKDLREFSKAEVEQKSPAKLKDEEDLKLDYFPETELSDEDWFKKIENN